MLPYDYLIALNHPAVGHVALARSVGRFPQQIIQAGFHPVIPFFGVVNLQLGSSLICTGCVSTGAVTTGGFALANLSNDEAVAVLCRLEVQIWEGATNFQLSPHCLDRLPAALTTVDSPENVGKDTSIAIGQDGLPVISYRDVGNGHLKVAHCNDAACTSATLVTVDSAGQVGQYTSIAIGQDGLPVISYYDAPNRDLKVAHCNDATCASATVDTLDSPGEVGWYTSIAIGQDGLPVISYYDIGNTGLKVAHCNDATCASATLATLDGTGDVGWWTSIAIGVGCQRFWTVLGPRDWGEEAPGLRVSLTS